MSHRDNNDGKKQKKDKGINEWDDGNIVRQPAGTASLQNTRNKEGSDEKVKESKEGKMEKKDKGSISVDNTKPSEKQQKGIINQNLNDMSPKQHL